MALVVLATGPVSAVVYLRDRAALGPWLSGHLTNTVFVFVLVVGLGLVALLLGASRRATVVLAGLVLLGVLAFEGSQSLQPGQRLDPVDAVVSVVAIVLALALLLGLERRHLHARPSG